MIPEDFLRWAHHTANRLTHPADPNHDDVVQEGLVAVAAVLDKFNSPSAVYVTKAARHAMQAAAYDGKFTGLPDRRLRSGPPPPFADSLDFMAEETPGALIGETRLVQVDDGFDRVEWESLRPDLVEALSGLTDRDRAYVVDRFYRGHRDAEIGRESGRTTKAVSHRWATVIRPALRDALAHLEGVA